MKFFSYDLPAERIAQRPLSVRSDARLLHAVKSSGGLALADAFVRDLPSILAPGDVLVLNNSRVLPCRFFFDHGGREMEALLLGELAGRPNVWEALARPMRRLKSGDELRLSANLSARVLGRSADGERTELELISTEPVRSVILREGSMPLPGYIRGGRAEPGDQETYQTVFAADDGSVAAPTAGLHFTPELLSALRAIGIATVELTLHVGPASFQPVRDLETHRMPVEWYHLSAEAMRTIESGQRVIAVGTTAVRALESAARNGPCAVDEFRGTELFITPGFEFQLADAVMTNFHQPGTSHLLLVAAFIGEEETLRIYEHALAGEYRFLSYGDTMLLEREAQ